MNNRNQTVTRFDILHRDKFRCAYCGIDSLISRLAVDHIVPLEQGGSNTAGNLITSCHRCNTEKNKFVMSEDMIDFMVGVAISRCEDNGIGASFVFAAEKERVTRSENNAQKIETIIVEEVIDQPSMRKGILSLVKENEGILKSYLVDLVHSTLYQDTGRNKINSLVSSMIDDGHLFEKKGNRNSKSIYSAHTVSVSNLVLHFPT